jgi:carboxymethylenebutenolidase
MPVASEWIHFEDQLGFLAWPKNATTPLPAVLVIQELWGVDAHIQDVCARLANAGYAAFAPDLYAIAGQRPALFADQRIMELLTFVNTLPPAIWQNPAARDAELAKRSEPERTRIDETLKALFANLGRLDHFVPTLLAAARYLRESCALSKGQKVASVGFCMGGALSALLSAHDPALAGAAVFYGSASPALAATIACPVVGFYGGLDARVNASLPAFTDAMRAAGKRFECNVYEGAQHAFFNDQRPSYGVNASRAAFARLLVFLAEVTAAS